MFTRFVHSVQYSNFFQMAMGEAKAMDMAQMTGTLNSMALPKKGGNLSDPAKWDG